MKIRTFVAVTAAIATLVPSGYAAAAAAAGEPDPTATRSTFYFVSAHPDDEAQGWQLIEDFQHHYSVFVLLTRGENTIACMTAQEAEATDEAPKYDDGTPTAGPYMYEGPDSPVGEENLWERHPLGDPWHGRGTDACADARVSSWHWFLDDAARFDPGFPDFGISASSDGDPWADDDYQGRFCPPGHQGLGEGRPPEKQVGCADVWANGDGARVAFELPNALPDSEPFSETDVITAVQTLRENRAHWGIELLPEAGVMAAAPACHRASGTPTEGRDHETLHNALYGTDLGAGPQYGTVCDEDTNRIARGDTTVGPDRRYGESPGYQEPTDPVGWWELHSVEPTMHRTGPFQVNYGWLFDTPQAGRVNGPEWTFPLHTLWKRYD